MWRWDRTATDHVWGDYCVGFPFGLQPRLARAMSQEEGQVRDLCHLKGSEDVLYGIENRRVEAAFSENFISRAGWRKLVKLWQESGCVFCYREKIVFERVMGWGRGTSYQIFEMSSGWSDCLRKGILCLQRFTIDHDHLHLFIVCFSFCRSRQRPGYDLPATRGVLPARLSSFPPPHPNPQFIPLRPS